MLHSCKEANNVLADLPCFGLFASESMHDNAAFANGTGSQEEKHYSTEIMTGSTFDQTDTPKVTAKWLVAEKL